MDALIFLKEAKRMCNYYTNLYHDCLKCPMVDMPCGIFITDWKISTLDTYTKKVEQWSKEHPQRTRLQDFLKKYPNALQYYDGTPKPCCSDLGYCKECPKVMTCEECWNMPVEDE